MNPMEPTKELTIKIKFLGGKGKMKVTHDATQQVLKSKKWKPQRISGEGLEEPQPKKYGKRGKMLGGFQSSPISEP
nr:hypothetical protein CFP56_26516 [Quercus suber]